MAKKPKAQAPEKPEAPAEHVSLATQRLRKWGGPDIPVTPAPVEGAADQD